VHFVALLLCQAQMARRLSQPDSLVLPVRHPILTPAPFGVARTLLLADCIGPWIPFKLNPLERPRKYCPPSPISCEQTANHVMILAGFEEHTSQPSSLQHKKGREGNGATRSIIPPICLHKHLFVELVELSDTLAISNAMFGTEHVVAYLGHLRSRSLWNIQLLDFLNDARINIETQLEMATNCWSIAF
jgi:hypothetical protein